MGMFDSYYNAWQGQPVEVQTKRLENTLDSYRLGDFVSPLIQSDIGKEEVVCVPEDFSPAYYYLGESIHLQVQLLHYKGLFADACFHPTKSGAQSAQAVLYKNWKNPKRVAILFEKLLFHKANKEKEASYQIQKMMQLKNAYRDWQEEQRLAGLPEEERKKRSAWYLLRLQHKGMSFDESSFEEQCLRLLEELQEESSSDVLIDSVQLHGPTSVLYWNAGWHNNKMALNDLCECLNLDQLCLLLKENPSLLEEKENLMHIQEALLDASSSILLRNEWARFVLAIPHPSFLKGGPSEKEAYHYLSWGAIQGLDLPLFESLVALCVKQKDYKALLDAAEFVFHRNKMQGHGRVLLEALAPQDFNTEEHKALLDLCFKEGGIIYAQALLEKGFTYPIPQETESKNAIVSILDKKQVSLTGTEQNRLSAEEQWVLAWCKKTKGALEFLKSIPIGKTVLFLHALSEQEKALLEEVLPAEESLPSGGALRL